MCSTSEFFRRAVLLVFAVAMCGGGMYAQSAVEVKDSIEADGGDFKSPRMAVKSDLIYLSTLTPNAAFEFAVAPLLTVSIGGGYNPLVFSDYRKWKHFLVRPAMRIWFNERFAGPSIGIEAAFAHYNIGGINWPFADGNESEWRYDGKAVEFGANYGYTLTLSQRWRMSTSLGIGFVWTKYDRYYCPNCGTKIETVEKTFMAPTNVSLSLIYLIK